MASLRGASSIVDKWLADDESIAPKSNQLSFLPHNTADIGNERKGLGFKASKQGQLANRSSHENTLAQKLEKSNKKRKAEELNNFGVDIGNHGVADDFEEESRILATGKLPTAAKAQQQSQSLKAKSKPLRPNNKLMLSKVLADPVDIAVSSTHAEDDTGVPLQPQEQNDYNQQSPTKHKRKKTRSKQKNIRRDNRPDHARPQHLQLGSKDYAGRPLTENTKVILGI